MADMNATTMQNWLPEQWSQLATITYRSNTVIWPLLDRRWEPELPAGRGDTVQIPNFTQNASANARSTFGTGASLTFDAIEENQTSLVVNQLAYKAFRIPVEMSVQTMPNYISLLTDGIGEAIALKMDADVAEDGTNGFDHFTAIGTDGVDVTDDTVLEAETNLNNQNAPLSDRFAVVSPATRASLMKIDTYRNSLYGGSVGNMDGSKGAGYLGQIYSLDFYMSNNLEAGTSGKKNAVFHREAIAGVVQQNVTMVQDMNIEEGLFNQVAGYSVYGFVKVKSDFGREVDGK